MDEKKKKKAVSWIDEILSGENEALEGVLKGGVVRLKRRIFRP